MNNKQLAEISFSSPFSALNLVDDLIAGLYMPIASNQKFILDLSQFKFQHNRNNINWRYGK